MKHEPEICPFCFSENVACVKDDDQWLVGCDECHATGPAALSEHSATILWNNAMRRRASITIAGNCHNDLTKTFVQTAFQAAAAFKKGGK
jgi:hypothetical protein